MVSGVYKITNIINGKIYIGSSINIAKRKCMHFSDLRRGVHCNDFLQKSFNKHGEDAFSFDIIEICFPEDCIKKEQYYLDLYTPINADFGYNICKVAGSVLGIKRSDETKKRVSEVKKSQNVKISEEIKLHLSKINTGKKLSQETKDKIGKSSKGRRMSEEAKLKISVGNKGKPKSDAHKEAMRKAQLNSTYVRVCSEETKLKMSIAAKNRNQVTDETRAKLSESRRRFIAKTKLICQLNTSL